MAEAPAAPVAARPGWGRRAGGLVLGILLATLVAWSPFAVQPALAAGSLRVQADTTYTVDPDAARIHVAIDYRVTNNKANTATIIYYYRTLSLGIQPGARSVRAADGIGGIGASTTAHKNFTEVTVRLRANLYSHRTTTFTLRYDLPGGKPRSASPIRIGRAFVTFGVWAFGDRGDGSVEVRMPAGFTTTIDGGPMSTTTSSSGNVAKASPKEPDKFFAVVTGENSAAYDYERLTLGAGVNVDVLSWPEDDRWSESVTSTLTEGMPELRELVGLDWPVAKDLKVTERYTPSLEGYAGLFFVDEERIDVSEDLDPATILHEASHAWFNENLFGQRWIFEGLAEEYSWRVLTAVGGDAQELPEKPDRSDAGAQPLLAWTFPEAIRDEETSDAELYGYHASFWVIHQIVEAAGEDQMRRAFEAASSNVTAYPGEGTPETVPTRDDWHRFLDLVEPPGDADSKVIEDAIRAAVTTSLEAQSLDLRSTARDAYRDLLDAGDGWTPPWYVRQPLGSWLFPTATTRMAEATDFLALRDEVVTAAAAEGLALDGTLEQLYEDATDGFDEATALATAELAAVKAIADAHAKVVVAPDLFAQIGLMGGTLPEVPYEAARAAFASGDYDGAATQAGAAATIVTRAPTMGQERVIMGSIVAVAILGFLIFFVIVRRRRHRSRQPLAIEPGSAALLALDSRFAPGADATDSAQPSGTLGGHSDVASPPPGEIPSDQGGSRDSMGAG